MPKPSLKYPVPIPPPDADLPEPRVKGAWRDATIVEEFNHDKVAMARMIGSLRRYALDLLDENAKLTTLTTGLREANEVTADSGDLRQRLAAFRKEVLGMVADDILVEPGVLLQMIDRVISGASEPEAADATQAAE